MIVIIIRLYNDLINNQYILKILSNVSCEYCKKIQQNNDGIKHYIKIKNQKYCNICMFKENL